MRRVRPTAAASVVAWSVQVARAGVPGWDARAFRAINGLPDWLAPIVWAPMQAGALASPLVLAGVVAMRGDRRTAVRLAGTGVGAWAIAKVLKRSVRRGRPGDHDTRTVLRLGSADHGYGYPSGHAAVAATIAAAISDTGTPGNGSGAVVAGTAAIAGLVGISRIYVGAHYPLDVVGGWALGILLGDAYRAAEARVIRSVAS